MKQAKYSVIQNLETSPKAFSPGRADALISLRLLLPHGADVAHIGLTKNTSVMP